MIFSAKAQVAESPAPVTQPTSAILSRWVGRYSGRVATQPPQMAFDMTLVISPTSTQDRYNFTITYAGAFGSQERSYSLIVTDAEAGKLIIDERNGIHIPTTLAFDTLHSHFVVMGNRITTRYHLTEGGDIAFELITHNDKSSGKTGGPTPENPQIPEVLTLSPTSIQSALLARVKQ